MNRQKIFVQPSVSLCLSGDHAVLLWNLPNLRLAPMLHSRMQ